jgi:hypothetical protein
VHKRRAKELKEQIDGKGVPTQREIEQATGLGVDNGVVTTREQLEKDSAMEVV